MQEPDWCHRVGISSSQGRTGGYRLCKALILHAMNQKLRSSNYLITSHTLGPLSQLLPTLVQGALGPPFFIPSWMACLVSLTTRAGQAKSTQSLLYSLDRTVRVMVTTQTSWQGTSYELDMVLLCEVHGEVWPDMRHQLSMLPTASGSSAMTYIWFRRLGFKTKVDLWKGIQKRAIPVANGLEILCSEENLNDRRDLREKKKSIGVWKGW